MLHFLLLFDVGLLHLVFVQLVLVGSFFWQVSLTGLSLVQVELAALPVKLVKAGWTINTANTIANKQAVALMLF